ncbi:lysophospholipid acyltransferase family protein [Falsirhodobacter xinxiangensis]|uniref:lysophospholipid acyltransferase family protein n=1 Tax=Falsirhodobacter xinxiangensis TaxID=2530049 RepID=UPI0010AAEF6B|nr:lysophospholipid acyltransferase family protein [Rhodobacter xinxiangensis]
MTWQGEEAAPDTIGAAGWLRLVLRIPVLGAVVYGGLLLLLLLRLVEKPLFGFARPITPFVTQGVCKAALAILGIRVRRTGDPMRRQGAVVANHGSWLDIFVLNSVQRVYFVSKAEVAGWPGIGWLARATGTVFINRRGGEAKVQQTLFETRLRAGHHLLFFPEGTSTDTRHVLPFKSTLFAAFFTPDLKERMSIQPVTVVYVAPRGKDVRFYGWWGGMDFGPHLKKILAGPFGGRVDVVFHKPIAVADAGDRKKLALAAEEAVRSAHPAAIR